MVPEKTGTFTPNFTIDEYGNPSIFEVKQVGNVVYMTGFLQIDGTWTDLLGGPLGTITGVDAPKSPSSSYIPVITMDNNAVMHNGYIRPYYSNGDIKLSAELNAADIMIFINGFYFTA